MSGLSPQDVTVTFADGSTVVARIGVREIVEIERHWKSDLIPMFEASLYGAWVHLHGRPGPDGDESFEAWVDTVASIDDAVTDVDPSPPAVGVED